MTLVPKREQNTDTYVSIAISKPFLKLVSWKSFISEPDMDFIHQLVHTPMRGIMGYYR